MKAKVSSTKFHKAGYTNSVDEAKTMIAYWNGLEITEQDHYTALAEVNGENASKTECLAISVAWTKSPQEVAGRKAEKEAYDNELLTCELSGEKVARKDCVVMGEQAYSKVALPPEAKKMLGIEDEEVETEEVVNEPADEVKARLNYIHTGRNVVPRNWVDFKIRYNVA